MDKHLMHKAAKEISRNEIQIQKYEDEWFGVKIIKNDVYLHYYILDGVNYIKDI